jgi:hypothetical protein
MNMFIFHKLLSMVQGLEGLEFPYGHPWPCTVCITQWFRCCAMNGWVRTARRLLAAKAQVSKCLEDMMNFHEFIRYPHPLTACHSLVNRFATLGGRCATV